MTLVQPFDDERGSIARNAERIVKLTAQIFWGESGANGNALQGPPVREQGLDHPPPSVLAAEDILMENFEVLHESPKRLVCRVIPQELDGAVSATDMPPDLAQTQPVPDEIHDSPPLL